MPEDSEGLELLALFAKQRHEIKVLLTHQCSKLTAEFAAERDKWIEAVGELREHIEEGGLEQKGPGSESSSRRLDRTEEWLRELQEWKEESDRRMLILESALDR